MSAPSGSDAYDRLRAEWPVDARVTVSVPDGTDDKLRRIHDGQRGRVSGYELTYLVRVLLDAQEPETGGQWLARYTPEWLRRDEPSGSDARERAERSLTRLLNADYAWRRGLGNGGGDDAHRAAAEYRRLRDVLAAAVEETDAEAEQPVNVTRIEAAIRKRAEAVAALDGEVG